MFIFPTDYNLLWDSSRKALDIIKWFIDKYPTTEGWRKADDWFKSLKNLSRAIEKASVSGGKGKDERLKRATKKYLKKAISFRKKLEKSKNNLPINETEKEHASSFKKIKNKHSAVESNINELEHKGLDRCPDRGFHGFKRYIDIGISITAYNLHRIGKQLLKLELEKQKKNKRQRLKSAA